MLLGFECLCCSKSPDVSHIDAPTQFFCQTKDSSVDSEVADYIGRIENVSKFLLFTAAS